MEVAVLHAKPIGASIVWCVCDYFFWESSSMWSAMSQRFTVWDLRALIIADFDGALDAGCLNQWISMSVWHSPTLSLFVAWISCSLRNHISMRSVLADCSWVNINHFTKHLECIQANSQLIPKMFPIWSNFPCDPSHLFQSETTCTKLINNS